MRHLIDIAVDVLRKSAIFLHLVNHYSDPLKHIFEQQFLHRKDLCLFANAFHSIKMFTSKSQLKEAPLYNENDILTVYMLFATCHDFRVRLEAHGGSGDPIIMKNYDVVLVTDRYPVDEFSVSHSNIEYLLISFSISKTFYDFITKPENTGRIEKYTEFHKKYSVCFAEIIGVTTPYEKLTKSIIDHIKPPLRKNKKSPRLVHQTEGFKHITNEIKLSLQLKYLYWTTIIKKSRNTEQINACIEALAKIEEKKKKKNSLASPRESMDVWDEIELTHDAYEGAWDYVGYNRRSRRIRGLDVSFENNADRLKRQQLEVARKQRLKMINAENERNRKADHAKFGKSLAAPRYHIVVNKKLEC